ncbi:MAG: hypothetical protein KDJ75_02320 [Alphaproteobacteria bacterium]|nr:hypothetical protein [Alphaproteobacteria bacterium]
MAAFDFVDSAAQSYQFVWEKRQMLARLAFLPLMVKLGCFAAVILLGLEENFLRQGLFLLPSYFAEGWLVCMVVRHALLPGRDAEGPAYVRTIIAAMIVYVLIQLIMSLLSALALTGQAQAPAEAPPPTGESFVAALLLLAFTLWAFRLIWLYIPVVLGYSVKDFLFKARGYRTSFYMIGTWLLCFVPFGLFLVIVSQLVLAALPAQGETLSLPYMVVMAAIQGAVEMLVALVSSVAMAYGIRSIYEGAQKRKQP